MLRTLLSPPVAAVGAGGRMVVLAGQRLPGESLGLVTTQLEHVWSLRIDRDAAVQPVAAEIGEAPAPSTCASSASSNSAVAYSGCAPVITVR